VSDVHPLLSAFPLVTTIPLLWGDEDAFGHVNNLVYLRWAESARVDYLRLVGLWTELPPSGVGPILASLHCDYKAQLLYPGTVQVGTRVSRVGNSSIQMEHHVVSLEQNALAAFVDSTLVMLDYRSRKPARVTPEARRAIAAFQHRDCQPPAPGLLETEEAPAR
jgi:acyl-CoA thioester hydrolase